MGAVAWLVGLLLQVSPRNGAAKELTQSGGAVFGYGPSGERDWRLKPMLPSAVDAAAAPSTTGSTTTASHRGGSSAGYGAAEAGNGGGGGGSGPTGPRRAPLGGCASTIHGCCASDGATPRASAGSEAGCPAPGGSGAPGLSALGLDGRGEIVSVGDTGLDHRYLIPVAGACGHVGHRKRSPELLFYSQFLFGAACGLLECTALFRCGLWLCLCSARCDSSSSFLPWGSGVLSPGPASSTTPWPT